MRIAACDIETFFSATHSLSKMSPIAYVMHPETELISCAIKIDDGPTDVVFGEGAIKKALTSIDWSDTMAIGHNMSGFDSMIMAWRLGITPRMWGCTLSMARPIHELTVGKSLGKLVAHYELGVKDQTALMNTKGRHLKEFTPDEIDAMREYNKADVEQCYALFHKLKPHFTGKELWHIDATIRMLVDPKFDANVPMLEAALCMERDQKRKHILVLARHLRTNALVEASESVSGADTIEVLEEAVRAELASAPKFSALLESLGVETPMKPSPTNPEKQVPALAKTDEGFIALQEHDNELVAAAARARLAVKSTQLETRIQAFIDVAGVTNGKVPMPLNYCGATTTGRWSGAFGMNVQNMPRILVGKPKVGDALRNCLKAPPGHKVVVADLSGIELRVNMFLWKVPYALALFRASPGKADLYKTLASEVLGVPYDDVQKMQRQAGKAMHLGCGFGLGSAMKFIAVAKTMAQIDVTEDEATHYIAGYREKHPEIVNGWRTCHARLPDIYKELEEPVDPWGLTVTCAEGIRLPSGRLIRYPGLHKESTGGKSEWWYGTGRHRARIYAGKIDENIVQALARDVVADNALEVFRATGFRPQLSVHDELVYVVPEGDAVSLLDCVQSNMRTPPKWWPELVTWSEGDIADTYGGAKG